MFEAMRRGSLRRSRPTQARTRAASGFAAAVEAAEPRVLLSGSAPEDTLVVRFEEAMTRDQAEEWAASHGMELVTQLRRVFPGAIVRPAAGGFQDASTAELIRQDPAVSEVEQNSVGEFHALPNDPLVPDMWALNNTGQTGGTADADIDALEAWDLFDDASDVVVAIVDSGVDYNHPDLAPVMWENELEIAGNGIDDDGNGYVDDVFGINGATGTGDPMDFVVGHGTHVAGTAAAAADNGIGVSGVARGASIMALAIDNGGRPTSAGAIASLEYLTEMRVDRGVNVVSSNHSYTIGPSPMFEAAIAASIDAGVTFVAAAGNDSQNVDSSPRFPASYDMDGVLVVAATDHNDNLAGFSAFGAVSVDIGAPGVNIMSTVPQGTSITHPSGYSAIQGTSMASPHVAGAAAYVSAIAPQLTPAEVSRLLMDTADRIPSLDGRTVSGGRLNLEAAAIAAFDTLAAEYGDAPDTYGTLRASAGAAHKLDPAVRLGPLVNEEPDGQPGPLADLDAGDDGVIGFTTLATGEEATLMLEASVDGFVGAWIDYDQSGTFDRGEFFDAAVTAGMNTLSPIVPSGATPGDTYARFRFSTDPLAVRTPGGRAPDGEVEDYLVTIAAGVNDPPVIGDQTLSVLEESPVGTVVGTVAVSDADPGDTLSYTLDLSTPIAGAFDLDPDTGVLTVADADLIDFEVTATFLLDVTVTDLAGETDSAVVTVNLIDDDFDLADDFGFATPLDEELRIELGELEANDELPADVEFLSVGPASAGTVTFDETIGEIVYTPDGLTAGPVTFDYTYTVPPSRPASTRLTRPEAIEAGDRYGNAVAVDGTVAAVATARDDENGDSAGVVNVFEMNADGTWSPVATLYSSDNSEFDTFGASVSVSGGTIVVGAPRDASDGVGTGAAYVFERVGGVWQEVARLQSSAPAVNGKFGAGVAVDGDRIAVGSPAAGGGVVTLFGRDGSGQWLETDVVAAGDPQPGSDFGQDISLAGDTLAVGARNAAGSAVPNATGAVYVFQRADFGVWVQEAKLVDDVNQSVLTFGTSVAAGEGVVVVGQPLDDGIAADAGAAYVYERSDLGEWGLTQTLTADVPAAFNRFGGAVAVDGDRIAVGSTFEDVGGSPGAGAVHLFERDLVSGLFGHYRTAVAGDGLPGDGLGVAVDISGDAVVAGADLRDDMGDASGAAYVLSAEIPETRTATVFVEVAPAIVDQAFDVAEETPGGTSVGTIATVGTGSGTPTFTVVGGTGAGLFDVDANTGEVLVGAGTELDFETPPNAYTLEVELSTTASPSLSDTATITINVTDVPLELVDDEGVLDKDAAATVPLADLTANDEIPAGADFAGFADVAGNGSVAYDAGAAAFTVTPDGTDGGTLSFTYTFTYADGGDTLTDTATVTYDLVDQEFPPVVGDETFDVLENAAGGTVVGTVAATDQDGDGVSFAITAGNDDGHFEIDSATGEITVAAGADVDFESRPVYTLTVTATDDSADALSGSGTVTVNVTDLNNELVDDRFTVIEGDALTFTLAELLGNDEVSATATFGGNTSPAGGTLSYDAGSETFTFTPDGSVIGDVTFEYTVDDTAEPGDTATVTISILSNEQPPAISDETFGVREDAEDGDAVGTVAATDSNGDGITFEIVSGNDDGRFAIDPATGEITVVDASGLDFEAQGPALATLTVRATDDSAGMLSSEADVTIELLDDPLELVDDGPLTTPDDTPLVRPLSAFLGNDELPADYTVEFLQPASGGSVSYNAFSNLVTFTPVEFQTGEVVFQYRVTSDDGLETGTADVTVDVTSSAVPPNLNDQTFTVNERAPAGVRIGTVRGSDGNGDTLTYAITGGDDAGRFQIDPQTGVITLVNPEGLDFETQDGPLAELTVTATDDSPSALSASATVTVELTNHPLELADDGPFKTDDDEPLEIPLSALLANDEYQTVDAAFAGVNGPAGDRVTYDAESQTLTFTPTEGETGRFMFTYTMVGVNPDNGANVSSTARVFVDVAAAQDPPLVEDTDLTVSENAADGTPVGTVTASDPDGDGLTFEITAGDAAGRFEIDSESGLITLVDGSGMDFETQRGPIAVLRVTVTDDGEGALSSDALVRIFLTDGLVEATDDRYPSALPVGVPTRIPLDYLLRNDDVTVPLPKLSVSGAENAEVEVAEDGRSVIVTPLEEGGVRFRYTLTAGFGFPETAEATVRMSARHGRGLGMITRVGGGGFELARDQGGSGYTERVPLGSPFGTSPLFTDFQYADFDGDGDTDVAARHTSSGRWFVSTLSEVTIKAAPGASSPSGVQPTLSPRRSWASWDAGGDFTDILTLDFDGDGRADIAARNLATGQWHVGLSTGRSFATETVGGWSTAVDWSDVQAADFDGDGDDDLFGRVVGGTGYYVAVSDGAGIRTSVWGRLSPQRTWTDIQTGDFDGDGSADLFARLAETNSVWTGISTGESFAFARAGGLSRSATFSPALIADFNGDGRDDFAVRHVGSAGRPDGNGRWYVGTSNGERFRTRSWGLWQAGRDWTDIQAADIDGDGRADIVGRVGATGSWWIAESQQTGSGGRFENSRYGRWTDDPSDLTLTSLVRNAVDSFVSDEDLDDFLSEL